MHVNSGVTVVQINIDGESLEQVEDFTYLGSLSVQTTAHRKTSRLGLTKQGSHLVDSRTFGNLNSTTLRSKSVSTTVTLILCYYMVQNVGELLKLI